MAGVTRTVDVLLRRVRHDSGSRTLPAEVQRVMSATLLQLRASGFADEGESLRAVRAWADERENASAAGDAAMTDDLRAADFSAQLLRAAADYESAVVARLEELRREGELRTESRSVLEPPGGQDR